jgi:hypothetical protein
MFHVKHFGTIGQVSGGEVDRRCHDGARAEIDADLLLMK